jgi:hypothetical protein
MNKNKTISLRRIKRRAIDCRKQSEDCLNVNKFDRSVQLLVAAQVLENLIAEQRCAKSQVRRTFERRAGLR